MSEASCVHSEGDFPSKFLNHDKLYVSAGEDPITHLLDPNDSSQSESESDNPAGRNIAVSVSDDINK